jgi:hypothetical protein
MWSRNLNKENGGKRRIWVPRREKGRKRRTIRKERMTHERFASLDAFPQ